MTAASLAGGLPLLWRVPLNGSVIAQPLVLGGFLQPSGHDAVLLASTSGIVTLLDAATGAVVYMVALPAYVCDCPDMPGGVWGVTGTPAANLTTGRVFVASANAVHCLLLASGAPCPGWGTSRGSAGTPLGPAVNTSVYSALTLQNNVLYVQTSGHCDTPPCAHAAAGPHTTTI